MKIDSTAECTSVADSTETIPSATRIKQESVPPTYHNSNNNNSSSRLTPASMSTTPAATSHHVIQPRLLTPCSDTDGYPTSPAITSSPIPSNLLNSQASYDFPMGHFSHDPAIWSHSPMFPPYESAYTYDGMAMTFEHQGIHHHGECISTHGAGEDDAEHISVKHEHWENQCI